MNLSKLMLGFVVLSSANLSALCLTSNVEFSTGYRQDDFKTGENYFGESTATPPDEIRSWDTSAKHVDLWQVGGRFRLFFPELDCCYNNCGCGCFDWGFLRNFYVKGFGYWGEDIGDTHFEDHYRLPFFEATDTISDETHVCGKASNYRTYDWQIGLGYLIDLGCLCGFSDLDLGLGIIGGYSWHKQKLKTKSGDSVFFGGDVVFDDPIYDGWKFDNKWDGGFLGAEIYYKTCEFLFNLGYEYHWAHWKSVSDPNIFAIEQNYAKETRTSNKSSGNVVYLDTTYFICDCWDIGFGFKYAYYKAHDGHVHESFETGTDPFDSRGTWRTWQLTANVGYNW